MNITKVIYFIFFIVVSSCQDMKQENLPEFHVQICHPENKYRIEFVSDYIKTLEGVPAGLPYGGTSGRWGDSGSGWTEQHGTPIGANIVYYAKYEDTFYHLDVDFPQDKIKEYMKRAYSQGEVKEYGKTAKEFDYLGRDQKFGAWENPARQANYNN